LHLRVTVCHLLALVGATLADFSADTARERVQVGAANHKVCARLADLRAIEKQTDVFGRSVFAAHAQTMSDGF